MYTYIPLSSINYKFEQIAGRKDRIIVYNKADLANDGVQQLIIDAFRKYRNQHVIFTNANMDKNVKEIINFAADKHRQNPSKYPFVSVMVVGMPNVGKSSLINSMRRIGVHKGKAAKTGALPGVTRSVAVTSIKVLEDPPVYLVDTPGVMIPHIPDPVSSLKVALTGGIRDHLSEEEVMADYLLWRLNNFGNFSYVEKFKLSGPTDDINFLLPAISKRIGALQKHGEYNLKTAATFFIKQYRNGKYGKYTLDDISIDSLYNYFNDENPDKENLLSKNQEKKLLWNKKREKRLERWKRRGYYQK
ncbi:P-loop containing nucleoside triphosphate hydrolase protein [Glomus cerebriforme]|uniref:Mitochondrial GTPase 1 n=1 Tax=Glomus cerebriforme TaxID=658196 RepID=A0A397SJ88_9GLOM|nr:P-loop containing nucleoside triphosphate hydrolase protein [Glomus cerebriforme]